MKSTICAIATAPGGALGIIRVSGPEALQATDRIFRPMHGPALCERKSHTLAFGNIVSSTGEIIDEVLVSLFKAPHSYTGEDSTEISCHGSAYILNRVLQELVGTGCTMAAPGEYTQRAFLNGKMDLSQAEAVADLIASDSAASHRMAMNQMRGGFGRELSELRSQLLHITSLMELELDFSDHEDLEFADRQELETLVQHIRQTLTHLVESFRLGNALKNGVPVAIVGETNAGKSTLLNALLHEERAIVSDIHGTTRDVIEDTVNIGGIVFRFIDTAGIRETTDRIESLGIERSFSKMAQADIILWVIDAGEASQQIERLKDEILPYCKDKRILLLFNKCDIATSSSSPYQLPATLTADFPASASVEVLSISARNGQGLSELQQRLLSIASVPEIGSSEVIVSNVRHYESLCQALQSILRVLDGLSAHLSGDFISQDLRECLFHLAEITGGDITTDEVLGNIFKNFCIGK